MLDGDAKETIGLICKSTHFFAITPRRGGETFRLNVYEKRNSRRTNFTSFFWRLVYYWGVHFLRFVTNLDRFGIRFVFSSRRCANPVKSRPSLLACLQLVDLYSENNLFRMYALGLTDACTWTLSLIHLRSGFIYHSGKIFSTLNLTCQHWW